MGLGLAEGSFAQFLLPSCCGKLLRGFVTLSLPEVDDGSQCAHDPPPVSLSASTHGS